MIDINILFHKIYSSLLNKFILYWNFSYINIIIIYWYHIIEATWFIIINIIINRYLKSVNHILISHIIEATWFIIINIIINRYLKSVSKNMSSDKENNRSKRVCLKCLKDVESLQTCSRCMTAHYCSKNCQVSHWKG